MKMIFTDEDLSALFRALSSGKICDRIAEPCIKYKENGKIDCNKCCGGYLQMLLEGQEYDTLWQIIKENK